MEIQNKVLQILGCLAASLPSTYLGLPLIVKEVTQDFWNSILERTQRKLAGWKGKFLSNAGKMQLMASMLQGIPIYFLSLFKIRGYMADKLEKIHRTFLWVGSEEKKRMSLVNWDTVCLPKRMGNLGLRKIGLMNKALTTKVAWKLIEGKADWCRLMEARYLQGHPYR